MIKKGLALPSESSLPITCMPRTEIVSGSGENDLGLQMIGSFALLFFVLTCAILAARSARKSLGGRAFLETVFGRFEFEIQSHVLETRKFLLDIEIGVARGVAIPRPNRTVTVPILDPPEWDCQPELYTLIGTYLETVSHLDAAFERMRICANSSDFVGFHLKAMSEAYFGFSDEAKMELRRYVVNHFETLDQKGNDGGNTKISLADFRVIQGDVAVAAKRVSVAINRLEAGISNLRNNGAS